ncbi:MAG: DUF1638 domain-containing protein [Desulfobaccales bacterium]
MKTVILACSVMRAEIEEVLSPDTDIEVRYLEQALHRTPHLMTGRLQAEVDAVASYAGRIVLGYGLCSNGIVGVAARQQTIIVPRCHDCIALFLGSRASYDELFHKIPGTYYLTPGWIEEEKDPLSIVEVEYTPRVGSETAIWAMQEELKHYTHIALISSGLTDIEPYRRRALENAAFFGKEYLELTGTLDYFRKMACPDPGDEGLVPEEFLSIPQGQQITQEMFLSLPE